MKRIGTTDIDSFQWTTLNSEVAQGQHIKILIKSCFQVPALRGSRPPSARVSPLLIPHTVSFLHQDGVDTRVWDLRVAYRSRAGPMKFVPNHTSSKEGAFNIKGDLLAEALSTPGSHASGDHEPSRSGGSGVPSATLSGGVFDASASEVAPPSLLRNRYRFKEKLGSGAFGTTYVAEDTDLLDSKVVIKRLHNLDSKAIDLMKEEVRGGDGAQGELWLSGGRWGMCCWAALICTAFVSFHRVALYTSSITHASRSSKPTLSTRQRWNFSS